MFLFIFSLSFVIFVVTLYFRSFMSKIFGFLVNVSFRKVVGTMPADPDIPRNLIHRPSRQLSLDLRRRHLLLPDIPVGDNDFDRNRNEHDNLLRDLQNNKTQFLYKLRSDIMDVSVDSYFQYPLEIILDAEHEYLYRLLRGVDIYIVFLSFLPLAWANKIQAFVSHVVTVMCQNIVQYFHEIIHLANPVHKSFNLHGPTVDVCFNQQYSLLMSLWSNYRLKLSYRYAPSEKSYWFCQYVLPRVINYLNMKKEFQVNSDNIRATACCVLQMFITKERIAFPIIGIYNNMSLDVFVHNYEHLRDNSKLYATLMKIWRHKVDIKYAFDNSIQNVSLRFVARILIYCIMNYVINFQLPVSNVFGELLASDQILL